MAMKYHASISKKPSGVTKFGVPLFKVTVANKSVMATKGTYKEIQKRLKNMNRLKNEEERFRRMGDLLGAMDSPESIAQYAKTSRMMTNMFKENGIFTEHFNRLMNNSPEFRNDPELQAKLKEIYSIARSMTQYEFQRFAEENKDMITQWMNFYEQQKADPMGQTPTEVRKRINELYEDMQKYKKRR